MLSCFFWSFQKKWGVGRFHTWILILGDLEFYEDYEGNGGSFFWAHHFNTFQEVLFLLNAVASKFAMATAKAKQNIQELFEKFDTSGDGTLQLDEMAEVFSALILGFFSVELLWVGATNGMVVKLELGKGSRCRVLQVILADLQGGLRGIFGYWVLFASGSSKTPGGWSGKSTRVAMNSFKCTSSSHGCSQHLHVIPLTRKKLLERKLLMWRSSTISRMKAKSSRLLGLTIFFWKASGRLFSFREILSLLFCW